jgi:thioredoxin reductase (NADPH)
MNDIHNPKVVIIGSGPAGLTAAIYASRANLDTTVIAGYQPGGQLMITSEVENFPGFPKGIDGPELMDNMRQQAERFGTKVIEVDVTSVDFSGNRHKIITEDATYEADAVIIATGASAMWLGLPSEQTLMGRGVSGCATCDGFFFKDKEIAVVGGGDTALEEALFLTRYASKISLIHRRDLFRASRIMQNRVLTHPKIEVIYDSAVEEVLGQTKVEGLKLRNLKTEQVQELAVQGLFVAIGHKPNTGIFKGWLEMNEQGYLLTKNEVETSVPGVFVAGDVFDFRYRQAITAAGSGCKAALEVEKYFETNLAAPEMELLTK